MLQRKKTHSPKVLETPKSLDVKKTHHPKIQVSHKTTKRVKLLQQYNYRFLQEYQFSPSKTTPSIRYRRKRIRITQSGLRRIYRLLFLSQCISRSNDEPMHCVLGVASPERELPQPYEYSSEDDSIDFKAERFIENFYKDMRMQAREFA